MKIVFRVISPSVIGLFTLIIFFTAITNINIPLISEDRAIFIVLMIANFAMCSLGPIPLTDAGRWLSLFNVSLYVLGFSSLLVFIVVITAKAAPLPVFSSYRNAYMLLGIIVFIKLAVISIHYVISPHT